MAIAFDENVVLDGVSFQLARMGVSKALFGVAGSGKSTVLKLAMGLLRPDSGRIFLLGEEVTRMQERDLYELRRRVGIVFQESALFDSLKVYENVGFRTSSGITSRTYGATSPALARSFTTWSRIPGRRRTWSEAIRKWSRKWRRSWKDRSPRGRLAFGRAERDEAGKGLPGGKDFGSEPVIPCLIPNTPRKSRDP